MYFKTFTLNNGLNTRLTKEGFVAVSFREVTSYSDDGKTEFMIRVPDMYKYRDNLWVESAILPHYQRIFCLVKQPEPNYDELWNIYISSLQDDEIGSISLILEKYDNLLLNTLAIYKNLDMVTTNIKKKLIKLRKYINFSDSGLKNKLMEALLNQ